MEKHWWEDESNFPERTSEEDVYQHLIESLFHMPDDLAISMKKAFIKKYPFIDANKITNW